MPEERDINTLMNQAKKIFKHHNISAFNEQGPNLEDILLTLRDHGVYDINDLVRKILGSVQRNVRATSLTHNYIFDQILKKNQDTKQLIHHSGPEVPVIVDGIKYDLKELNSKFKGHSLNFIFNSKSKEEHVLYAVKTIKELEYYLGTPNKNPANEIIKKEHPLFVEDLTAFFPAFFYDDPNFLGNYLMLYAGLSLPNLLEVPRGPSVYFWQNWNDMVSSIITGDRAVMVCEDMDFVGNSLVITEWQRIEYVGDWWNDRVSSIVSLPMMPH